MSTASADTSSSGAGSGSSDAAPAAAPAAEAAASATVPAVEVGTVRLGPEVGGLEGVSRIGFGAMNLSVEAYGVTLSEAEGLPVLRAAYAAGYRHFDTAEVYRSGQFGAPPTESTRYNETLVGKFLAELRGAVGGPRPYTVATKYLHILHGGRTDLETVEAAVDASRLRLGVDQIDLYYFHRMPETVEALEEWMRSVKVLVERGKIRTVGLSEVSAAWLRRAHAVHPVAAVQMEWSALTRGIETDLIPTLRELQVGVVAYSPLARNLLAGVTERPREGDWRLDVPRFADENFAHNQALVARVVETAKARGGTAAQLSLAWLYQRAEELGVTLVAIPGTTSAAHASDNIGSLALLPLPVETMAAVDEISKQVAGARGSEQYVKGGYEGQQ